MVLSPNDPTEGGGYNGPVVEPSPKSSGRNKVLYYALGIAMIATVAVLFLNR